MDKLTIPSFQVSPEESMVLPTQFGFDIPVIESLTQDSFVMPQNAQYEISEEITLDFTDAEVMELIANAVSAFPQCLDAQFPNMVQIIDNKIIEMANYEINLVCLSKVNQAICDFLQMVKAGLIVFKSTIRNVNFPIKIVFITDRDITSPYYKGTVYGPMFKGIPSIQSFSEETVNSVINKFYKSHINNSNPYKALLEKVAYKGTEEAIQEVELSTDINVDNMSNVEIASAIIAKEIGKKEFVAMSVKMGKSRTQTIAMIVQTMRED